LICIAWRDKQFEYYITKALLILTGGSAYYVNLYATFLGYWQARQAYLIGNGSLARELSRKGQLYNMQMKAAHGKAKENIYRQRLVIFWLFAYPQHGRHAYSLCSNLCLNRYSFEWRIIRDLVIKANIFHSVFPLCLMLHIGPVASFCGFVHSSFKFQ